MGTLVLHKRQSLLIVYRAFIKEERVKKEMKNVPVILLRPLKGTQR